MYTNKIICNFLSRNLNGGRWIINLDKRQRAEHLDNYWLEILFFLIGEHADQHAHQVLGLFIWKKKNFEKWKFDCFKYNFVKIVKISLFLSIYFPDAMRQMKALNRKLSWKLFLFLPQHYFYFKTCFDEKFPCPASNNN